MDLKEENLLGDNVNHHWYYRAKLAALVQATSDLLPSHVLDVGAGSGFFSKGLILAGRATSATCLDPLYPAERDESVSGGWIRFRRSLEGEKTVPSLVLMMDVLEHVRDDAALVREYVRQMPSGTHVIVTVPAFQWLWSKHDVFLEHFRRYTLRELETTLRSEGLRIEFGSYYYGSVLPAAATFRFIKKIFGRRNQVAQSDMRQFPPLLNWIFWMLCRTELSVMRRNRIAGLSVFVRAVKR